MMQLTCWAFAAALVAAASCVAVAAGEAPAQWIVVAPDVPRQAATAFFARDWNLGADIRRATLRTSSHRIDVQRRVVIRFTPCDT